MPALLREWMRRLAGLLRRGRSDEDLEDELRAHLALAAEDLGRHQAAPADRHATLAAGGVDQAMEALRDQRGVPLLASAGRDLREATRLFTRTPALAAVATISLALSLALGLIVFRVVNAYVWRALPYPAADRLYSLTLAAADRPFIRDAETLDWAALDDIAERRIAWDLDMFYLLGADYPEPAPGAWVTPGFVEGLGVRAILGRVLQPDDFAPAGATPIMISHRLWTTRFGGDAGVLGVSVQAYVSDRPEEAETFVIVGVLAPEFWHVNTYTEIVAPLRAPAYPYMVTLRPGVTSDLAVSRIRALVAEGLPDLAAGWRVQMSPVQARYIETVTPALAALGVTVVLVILIACANVAVLLLVRAVRRQHEMALRLALGASRLRLAQLMIAEAALLALVATGVALVVSGVVLDAAVGPMEGHLGRRLPGGVEALAIDSTLALTAIGAVVAVAAVLTAVPLTGAVLPSLGPGLVSAGRNGEASRPARRVRAALVAVEVAGALALLVGAGLMIGTTERLLDEDLGIRGDVVTTSIGLRFRSYPTPESRAIIFTRLQRLLGERTGVPVALGGTWPLQPGPSGFVAADGDEASGVRAAVTAVSAEYFETLGIPLIEGTAFAADDRPGGARSAVVSGSLAARLWPEGSAVGRVIRVPAIADNGTLQDRVVPYEVVGIAGDVSQLAADGPGIGGDRDHLDVYVPLFQQAGRFAFVYARESGFRGQDVDDTFRRTVAAIAPDAAVAPPRVLQSAMDQVLDRPRRLAWLLSVLALSATLLAMLGVSSVLAYAVRQREREIGVRLAVGATPSQVVRLFVGEGGRLIALGLAAGLVGAVALGRTLETQLFGVRPVEPWLLASAVAALAAGGILACWWPARRAARIGPAQVLRGE